MPALDYTQQFTNHIRTLYGAELKSIGLYDSNKDLNIVNGNQLKIPTLSVSGYKDHSRTNMSFNTGTYQNGKQVVQLDHDRDIEFPLDPMDLDETNLVVSIANIQKRFDSTQAIPEQDCYTFSKLYTEFKRAGGTVSNTVLTKANILDDFDAQVCAMEDAGVPLSRIKFYVTANYKKLLKEAEGITRTLNLNSNTGSINRTVHTLDELGEVIVVPSERFKTSYNFTNGYAVATTGKQINYIMVDPEAQVSRVKYSYIKVFTPGTDSRTADKYVYQNRKFNGTFAIDELITKGCKINAEAEA